VEDVLAKWPTMHEYKKRRKKYASLVDIQFCAGLKCDFWLPRSNVLPSEKLQEFIH